MKYKVKNEADDINEAIDLICNDLGLDVQEALKECKISTKISNRNARDLGLFCSKFGVEMSIIVQYDIPAPEKDPESVTDIVSEDEDDLIPPGATTTFENVETPPTGNEEGGSDELDFLD